MNERYVLRFPRLTRLCKPMTEHCEKSFYYIFVYVCPELIRKRSLADITYAAFGCALAREYAIYTGHECYCYCTTFFGYPV